MTRLVLLGAGALTLACGGRIEKPMPRDPLAQAANSELGASAEPSGANATSPNAATMAPPDGTSPSAGSQASSISFAPPPNDPGEDVAAECSATVTLYQAGDGTEPCSFTVEDSVAIEGLVFDAAVLALVDPETQSELFFPRLADAMCNTPEPPADEMGWSVAFGDIATIALCAEPCALLHSAPRNLVLTFEQGILCDPSNQIR